MALKEELTGILDTEDILDGPETLEAYSRDFSFARPVRPRMVIRPRSMDQVQSIVGLANEQGVPLVTVSSGPPRFHGDTVPGVEGAVVVDLSGMKRIVDIDRRNRIAVIEAGVTYTELQPELARHGLRLTMPLAPRSNKSVIASLLEREPTVIPRQIWTAVDPLRSTWIIWGDGKLLRTGDAGNAPSIEEARKRKQAMTGAGGPGQTDFYRFVSAAQGSMGIVPQASVKCEVLPQPHRLFLVPARKLEDLLDFTYRVLKFRFADELFILNGVELAYLLGEDIKSIGALKEKLPAWMVVLGIAGRNMLPEERVAFQEKDIAGFAGQCGLEMVPEVPGAGNEEVMKAVLSPSREPYWKLTWKGNYQDILFINTLDRMPGFVEIMESAAGAGGYPEGDIGVYLQPLHQGSSCHCEFTLPFNGDDGEETAGMEKLLADASRKLMDRGAFFSRPYGIWADMAYSRDPQSARVLKGLKGIFDPNKVLNPGKLCF